MPPNRISAFKRPDRNPVVAADVRAWGKAIHGLRQWEIRRSETIVQAGLTLTTLRLRRAEQILASAECPVVGA